MSIRAPLIAGTVVSLAAVSAWSWMADLAVGPPAPLHLGRNVLSDYAQLVAAPTGNGAELFAVVAVIYALCLLVYGWRRDGDR
jgi:type IV secretory pathway VirB2 component (pilin)